MAKYDVYYDEFKDLWLRDDPEWISERENLWKKVLTNMETYHRRSLGDKNYITQLKHYFVYGQHLMYKDKIVRNFIGGRERILCVPWKNERELEKVFRHGSHIATTRVEISNVMPYLLSYYYKDTESEWKRIELLCKTIYGNKYEKRCAKDTPLANDICEESANPYIVFKTYINHVSKFIIDEVDHYTWLNCSFDYFVSCAQYIEDNKLEVRLDFLKKRIKSFELANANKDKMGVYQKQVFNMMYDYLMSDSAPGFILDYRSKGL